MFENQNQKLSQNTSPVGQNPIDDIFADVDTEFKPTPTSQTPTPVSGQSMNSQSSPSSFPPLNPSPATGSSLRPTFPVGGIPLSNSATTPNTSTQNTAFTPASNNTQKPSASNDEIKMYRMMGNDSNPFPINPGTPAGEMTPRFPQNPLGKMDFNTPVTMVNKPTQPLTSLPEEGGSRHWVLMSSIIVLVILGGGGWYAYREVPSVQTTIDSIVAMVTGKKTTSKTPTPKTPDTTKGTDTSTPNTTSEGITITPTDTTPAPTPTPTDSTPTTDTPTPTDVDTTGSVPVPTPPPSTTETGAQDSDRDGLSDAEEQTLGTDIASIDTDGDGLFDYEEVKIFQTNPKVTDTDKDGYSDFAEIKNGYNPNGSGKLPTVN